MMEVDKDPVVSLWKRDPVYGHLSVKSSKSKSTSPTHKSEPSGSGIKRQTPLTSSQRENLYSVLSREMKRKLKS